jgi:hypothetical protein
MRPKMLMNLKIGELTTLEIEFKEIYNHMEGLVDESLKHGNIPISHKIR